MLSSIKEYQPEPQIQQSIWMTLGLPSRGTRLHDLVREGLRFEYLERIASLLQVQPRVVSKAVCMSPTTMARRAKAGRFDTVESDRLVALVVLFDEALSLFESDVTAATEWMSVPVRGLGSKRPIDMLGNRWKRKLSSILSVSWRREFLCETQQADDLMGSITLASSDNPQTHEYPHQVLTHLPMGREVLHLGCP